MDSIKFHKHYVTNGTTKARVSYHFGKLIDGRECVTLYAKDYGHALGAIFADGYQNDSDLMTDYFDKGLVRIYPGEKHFDAAMGRVIEWNAQWAKKTAEREAKYAARRGDVMQQQVAA
jgi:hypothetical protein